jgi:hypothetical protein
MTVSTSSFSSLSKSDKKSKVTSNNAKQNKQILLEENCPRHRQNQDSLAFGLEVAAAVMAFVESI